MTLHEAAPAGNARAVKRRLARRGDVNAKAAGGVTALHVAAAFGQTETCALLLDRGAEINAKSADGWTPLHWAAWQGHGLAPPGGLGGAPGSLPTAHCVATRA